MSRRLCIEIHDVAPATWSRCETLFALADACGCPPLTLLVVPNYHALGDWHGAPDLVRKLRTRLECGDEMALHGYTHVDDGALPGTPRAWLRRRVLTAGEGEFATLEAQEAGRRVRLGLRSMADLVPAPRGFVAPAWLSSIGTWQAVRAAPLEYAATRSALVTLPGLQRIPAPAISASARSASRRAASRVWLRAAPRWTQRNAILRLALHAADADHPGLLEEWRKLIVRVSRDRVACTLSRAAGAPERVSTTDRDDAPSLRRLT